LLENPLHDARTNAKFSADLEDAITVGPECKSAWGPDADRRAEAIDLASGEGVTLGRLFTVMTISPFPILPSTPSLSRTIAVLAALFVNR
jgi:hypothetical protein